MSNILIQLGRADVPGRPILYSSAPNFYNTFGLNTILEMPSLAMPEEECDNHDQMLMR